MKIQTSYMQPKFVYKIPSSSWHIVITDTSNHFYFNNDDKLSYWQLSDVKEKYNIDITNLMQNVNFDDLSLLFAKSRGLKVKERTPIKQSIDGNEEDQNEQLFENSQKENVEDRSVHTLDKDEESPTLDVESNTTTPQSNMFQGYSSSDDDDDDSSDG